MFYVYTLTDPRTAKVFYVGKGKDRRAWQHTEDAKKGRKGNERKLAIIREILEAGGEPVVLKVAEYDDEADAFEHEAELIATLPGLANILAKGGGWALAPEEIKRRAEERKKRVRHKEMLRGREWLSNWLKVVEKWPAVTFPNMKDGNRRAQEFLATVRELLAMPVPNI